MLHSVDLHLEPNEASDLAEVCEPGLLEAHGWDRTFLTVLDEVGEQLVAAGDEVRVTAEIQPPRRDEPIGAPADPVARVERAQPQRVAHPFP